MARSTLLSGAWDADPFHGRHEPVAAFRQGLDEALRLRIFAKGFAQQGNVGGEASLLNGRVGPQTLQQFFSGEHLASGLHQGDQELGHLERQRHVVTPSKQHPALRFEAVRSELVLTENIAGGPQKFIRKIAGVPKDY